MTTEQPPPLAQEHRRSRWWPFDTGAGRPRFEELAAPYGVPGAPDGGPAADGPGPFANGSESADHPVRPENGSVIHGEVVTDDQRAARELASQQEQAAAERLPLPSTFRQELRLQLADFAERAHQKRLDPAGPELLGSGGGITERVVQAMARMISAQNLPGPAGSQDDRMDLLLGALVETDPKQVTEAGHVSFVTLRGRLMLDVSTAAIDGESLTIDFVRLPSHSEPGGRDATDQSEGDLDGTGDDAAGFEDDGDLSARYAAVICGPAAVIAGGRPFLGMDVLMTYARREAFRRFNDDSDPQAVRNGMRAAHSIEIVVLLDPSLDGGVWVDVDPATGCPAAAMSITVKRAGFRFTPLSAA
jgi:hypothetical protein